MPRGKKAAEAPAAPKKRGPKPGAKALAAAAVAAAALPAVAATVEPHQAAATPPAEAAIAPEVAPVVQPAAAEQPAELPRGPGFGESLKRGRSVDVMAEDELRAYAREISISKRDADGLSIERLRQNCKAQLYELIDAL